MKKNLVYLNTKILVYTIIFVTITSVSGFAQNPNWTFNKYVTVNGAGNHDGSSLANAWTIREAVANVNPGDVVFVQKGQYDITGVSPYTNITLSRSGTINNPIVFYGENTAGYDPETANGSELAWFYCNSATNGQININGNYIEWRNIATYQVSGRQTYNISGDNVLLDSCVIITAPTVSSEHTVIIKPASQNGILRNSYLLRSGRCHIYVESDNNESADNWIMDNNTFKGASNHNSIEYMPLTNVNPAKFIYGCVIKNNLFIDNPYSHNILLRHNMDAKIYNNVFINSGYIKFEPHNYGAQTTSNVLVAYNTFVENNNDYVLDNQAMNGVIWYNNLYYYPSGLSTLYIFRIGNVFINNDFDYNYYYSGSSTFNPSITYSSSTNYSGWQSTYGFDTHSTAGIAPTFENVGINNFKPLNSSSPQVGKGTPITTNAGFAIDILTDKDGNPRDPNNPTIGAYEFFNGTIIDITPPRVISANLNDPNTLVINFSEPLSLTSAQNINNYSISNGINVSNASLTGSKVTLTTTTHIPGTYTISVINVTDLAGNVIDPNHNTASYNLTGGDVTAPQLVSATIIDSVTLNLQFSENLEGSSAQNIVNYTINDISINSAVLNSNVVTLSTSVHSEGIYTVTVNNVTDLAGNFIDPQHNTIIYEYQSEPSSGIMMLPVSQVLASVTPEPDHTGEKTTDGKGYFEGDPDSRWAGDTMPEWLVYDLGDIQVLNSTKLSFYKWNEGRTYDYSVQLSTDSLNWTTVRTNVSSLPQEWSEELVGPVEARYVKIIFVNSNQNSWAGLWEAEFWGYLKIPTGLEESGMLPKTLVLDQNYPNPFNPTTKIKISVPLTSSLKLTVYNMLGELVSEIANDIFSQGNYEFEFNAEGLASGIYLYRLESGSFIETKKMVLLR